MITPSFALTATERVLPKLALDFTTASLDPRVTFTRTGNTATVTNSSGYVVSINADLPRFDYNPITLACKGLLVEETRTNSLIQSSYYAGTSPANWGRVGITAPYGVVNSPEGTLTASQIIGNGSTTNGFLYNLVAISTTASQVFTISGYFKYNTRRYLQLVGGTSVNGFGAVIDLVNGSITATGVQGTGVYQNSSITNVGNDWYRVTVTGHCGATTNVGYFDLFITDVSTYTSGVPTITASTASFYLWGAQLEVGAFATSYIPTTTTALTRNADVATMTGTNFSDWYNATEGSFVFDYDIPVTRSFGAVAGLGQGTFDTSIRFNVVNAMRATGTSFPNLVVCGTAVLGANKMACALKVNDYRSFVNGVSNGTDTTATMVPSPNQFKIGKDEDTDNVYANGWIRKIFYYPQRLTNAELAAFSK